MKKSYSMAEQLERNSVPEPNSGCILWLGCVTKKDGRGYGTFTSYKEKWGAHRAAWTLAYGAIPSGLSVLHKCDVPSCVNPRHLFLGTPLDNILDAKAKGRIARGERNGMSKLSREDVFDIRASRAAGEPLRGIAARHGVCDALVSHVTNYRIWKED